MKLTTGSWGDALRIARQIAGFSREQLGHRLLRDRYYVRRIELEQTVVTDDALRQWIDACGGVRMVDRVIRQLQALRALLDSLTVGAALLQA